MNTHRLRGQLDRAGGDPRTVVALRSYLMAGSWASPMRRKERSNPLARCGSQDPPSHEMEQIELAELSEGAPRSR